LNDGDTLFNISFKVTGESAKAFPVAFESSPTPIEISDSESPVDVSTVNGEVYILNSYKISGSILTERGSKIKGSILKVRAGDQESLIPVSDGVYEFEADENGDYTFS